ncbi:Diacylglycerol kinase family enzyme [Kytococcus aerolatus]|uniref:Diacylglycerol kinase family enzyme n=1 Tax=Kytococcus aerolatus TaxID=592308 RepID=A0A212T1X0_9MICO|nr:diacylglycerol kinase family protein [Kytococcus aerolatus]SNC60027.1 Diacylglycerol kinase family enzyme [Kytococcus aerolatus]
MITMPDAPSPASSSAGAGSSPLPRVGIVHNPVHPAGSAALQAARRLVAELGWPAPVVWTTSVDSPGAQQAREALAAGVTRLLVIGGDGTVRQVADVLAGTDVVLGIAPTGTANLAARNLGLTAAARHGVDHLVTAALTTSGQPVDIARATWEGTAGLGRGSFLVAAGLGHDAAIISSVSRRAKEQRGPRAYVRPALGRALDAGWPMRVDGRESEPWSLLVTNGGAIPWGLTVSAAQMADGSLQVVEVDPDPAVEWTTVALAGLLPGVSRLPGIERRSAQEVTLVPDSPTPAHLDGDPLGEVRSLSVSVEPGALLVAHAGGGEAALDPSVLEHGSAEGVVAVINGLRVGGIDAHETERVTQALTSRTGSELEDVKYLLNSGGDGHDLEHVVYSVLDAGQRQRVLEHLAREARPRDELRVLCDIDDTVRSALHDREVPRGTVYPGIVELLRALDLADADGDPNRPGDLTFVTARPGGFGGLVERYSRDGLDDLGLPPHTILTGSVRGLLDRPSMAAGKVRNLRRDAALFPECRQVFIGDSGQADADVALQLRREHPESLVAAFIHCVTEVPADTRAAWRAAGVHAVDDYAEAARVAEEIGLLDATARRRVERALAAGLPGLPA